jgi:hypothetical protein
VVLAVGTTTFLSVRATVTPSSVAEVAFVVDHESVVGCPEVTVVGLAEN